MKVYETQTKQPMSKESSEHQLWRYRVDRAIAKRKEQIRLWRFYRDYLRLDHYDVEDPEINDVAINKCRAFVNGRLATLAYKAPRCILRARAGSPEDLVQTKNGMIPKHKVMENLTNYLISQPSFGFARQMRRFAKAGITNMGVVRIGYEADYSDGHETKELYAWDEEQGFLTDPTTREMIQVQSKEYGRPYPKDPAKEKWFVEQIPAWRMLFDPDGEAEFYDHEWVGCEYFVPLDEVKKSRIFKKSVVKDLSSTFKPEDMEEDGLESDELYSTIDPEMKDQIEYVRIFILHCIKDQKIRYMADGCGEFLAVQDYPEGLDHSPYVIFRLDEEEGEFYPRPPIADAIPIDQQIAELDRLDITTRRQNIPKRIVPEGELDDDQLDVLNSPIPNEVVKCKAGRDPNRIVGMIPMGGMMMDAVSMRNRLEQSFDEVTGQTAMDRGAQGADLATEVNAIQNAQRGRTDDYRALYAESVEEVLKKLIDSVQANMTLPVAVSLDVNGEVFNETVDYDMITADVECEIDIEDMLPRSSDVEVAQLEHVMATIGQYPWLATKPALIGAWLDKIRVNNRQIRDELVAAAQEAFAAQNQANQPAMPGSMPQGPTDMLRQMGGMA